MGRNSGRYEDREAWLYCSSWGSRVRRDLVTEQQKGKVCFSCQKHILVGRNEMKL